MSSLLHPYPGAARRCPRRSAVFASALAALAALSASISARAEPCAGDAECASGFCVNAVCCNTACKGPCEACSAAAKGGGSDGTCGQAKAGTVCKGFTCDGADLLYTGPSTCDAAGQCVAPDPIPCLHDNPCKFDLCGDMGCETVTKFDGTECGQGGNGQTLTCSNGVCGEGSGAGGAGGALTGAGGAGDAATGAGGAGQGGAGGEGGAGGQMDLYPPVIAEPACGCRFDDTAPRSGAFAIAIGALALLFRRRSPRAPN